jgi:hypothetical protein
MALTPFVLSLSKLRQTTARPEPVEGRGHEGTA